MLLTCIFERPWELLHESVDAHLWFLNILDNLFCVKDRACAFTFQPGPCRARLRVPCMFVLVCPEMLASHQGDLYHYSK